MWLVSKIPLQSEILNPAKAAFADFELTDIVFSKLRSDKPNADTNIVIVNIGKLDRAGIAAQITTLNKFKPKIIGIDAAFRRPKDPEGDSALAKAFSEVDNLVLVSGFGSHLPDKQTKQFDTLETSHAMFNQHAVTGFANIIIAENDVYKPVRSFSPKEIVYNRTEFAFPVKMAQIYNPEVTERFLKRNNEVEFINYKGNITNGAFYALDVEDLFDPDIDLSFVSGKIVLMGFMGESFSSRTLEDKLYTPLNEIYIGKAHPDMYGVVVHANSISMILREEYVDVAPGLVEISVAVILCFLNVVLFSYLMKISGDWYDSLTILIQLIETCLIMFIVGFLFDVFTVKINLGVALAAVLLSSNGLELYQNIVLKIYQKRKTLRIIKLKKQAT
ncbi:CHASE2 domain-containing protein [Rhodocytophaga rosea]|uniref:CHASE2 domain-containing protein n=1 Tax=Rhodocytophaga rosea TaxID=2704465 RepID=A0A6C0GFP2_9BACT|nr:CHASE2 domain-containing protein [Rhodocytophaga rosea]QHT66826.1 CHASE2 domain-containing protein [Rhodocytophaga rosea]